MKVLQVLVAVIVLWALSLATVWLLKDWGPVEAVFEYAGNNAVLKAGSYLGAIVVLLLVLAYVFGKIAEAVGLSKFVKSLTNLQYLFPRE
jgi:hypothetical protein